MTGHLALLNLLGQDVTVTHPDAGHRVWRGRLRDVMHAPCLVLDLPDGRTEVLPQAFTVTPDTTVRTGPDTDAATSGPARAPVVGTAVTSADTVRTPQPDAASGRPDAPEWKACGDWRCIDPRCREEATVAEAREHIANTMELPLDLIAPTRCDCGQTGPLVAATVGGYHFHTSPEEHRQPTNDPDKALPGAARENCRDRTEALRADLERAVAAYEALRARLAIAGGYLRQQRTTGVLHGGQTRRTILTRLAAWTEDPGPLDLSTGARRQ